MAEEARAAHQEGPWDLTGTWRQGSILVFYSPKYYMTSMYYLILVRTSTGLGPTGPILVSYKYFSFQVVLASIQKVCKYKSVLVLCLDTSICELFPLLL